MSEDLAQVLGKHPVLERDPYDPCPSTAGAEGGEVMGFLVALRGHRQPLRTVTELRGDRVESCQQTGEHGLGTNRVVSHLLCRLRKASPSFGCERVHTLLAACAYLAVCSSSAFDAE